MSNKTSFANPIEAIIMTDDFVRRDFHVMSRRIGEVISQELSNESPEVRDRVLRGLFIAVDEAKDEGDHVRESIARSMWSGWDDPRPLQHQRRDVL